MCSERRVCLDSISQCPKPVMKTIREDRLLLLLFQNRNQYVVR